MVNENPRKILLVDDEPQNIRDLFEVLKDKNYKLLVAPNGKIAFDLALQHSPLAIIMDWDMPIKNGLDAVIALRATPETKFIPIIMATGKMVTANDLQLALEAGANDYIRKPFDNIEIIARVKAMIHLHQQHVDVLELQKEMARRELEQMNKQLEINTQAMIAMKVRMLNNANNLKNMIASIKTLIPHTSDEGKDLIIDIISSSKTHSLVVNWDEFNHLFACVHQTFYSTLQERFPDITLTEKKLCGLLKLNMVTKEIAAVMNISINAIKKTKYRLKIKLGLTAEESLTKYIQEIN